jgi:hypothetical protein
MRGIIRRIVERLPLPFPAATQDALTNGFTQGGNLFFVR